MSRNKGIRVQASGVMFHHSNFFYQKTKKFFLKFRTLEHGTNTLLLKLMLYINTFRRFFVLKHLEHDGTNYRKPNKSYLFCFFILEQMYKNIYYGKL